MFKTKNLIRWLRLHNAVVVTADLKLYKKEKVRVYYLKEILKIKKVKKEKRKPVKENELARLVRHIRRKLR